jgi:hypothetical protein
MFDTFAMELDDFPGASPDAFTTIRAALIDDPDLRLQELNGVFRTNANAAAAEIAFPGNEVNHKWRGTGQTKPLWVMSPDILKRSNGM